MPPAAYSFIDVAVLPEVRERFADGDAIAILAIDLAEIIWANGPGAALLGHRDIEAAIGADSGLGPAARRQVASTRGFPRIGRDRSVTIRFNQGMASHALPLRASAIDMPDGEQAIMLVAVGGERAVAGRAANAISGFIQPGHLVALLNARGAVEAASDGFSRLEIAPQVLADLVRDVSRGPDRLLKRIIPGGQARLPAGIARLRDDPLTFLLMVIDERADAEVEDVLAAEGEAADVAGLDALPADEVAATVPDQMEPAKAEDAEPLKVEAVAIAPEPAFETDPSADKELEPAFKAEVVVEPAFEGELQSAFEPQLEIDPTEQPEPQPGSEPEPHPVSAFELSPGKPAVADATVAPDDSTLAAVSDSAEETHRPEAALILDERTLEPAPLADTDQLIFASPDDAPVADEAVEYAEPVPAFDEREIAASAVDDAVMANPAQEPEPFDAPVDGNPQPPAGEDDSTIADDQSASDGEMLEPVATDLDAVDAATVEAPPISAEPETPKPAERSAAPVRFVWKTDAESRFSALSAEFVAAVGESAGDVIGRTFGEISGKLGLDPTGQIAGLLDRRDTWSGRQVLWPIAGTDLKVPVDLAALPVYSRDRSFEGFRGFGVARMADVVMDPEAIGLRLDSDGKIEAFSAASVGLIEAVDEPKIAEAPKDPFEGEVPALSIVPGPERRVSDKIIKLAEHRLPVSEKGLSPVEKIAFREIGERLKRAEDADRGPQPAEKEPAPANQNGRTADQVETPREATAVESIAVDEALAPTDASIPTTPAETDGSTVVSQPLGPDAPEFHQATATDLVFEPASDEPVADTLEAAHATLEEPSDDWPDQAAGLDRTVVAEDRMTGSAAEDVSLEAVADAGEAPAATEATATTSFENAEIALSESVEMAPVEADEQTADLFETMTAEQPLAFGDEASTAQTNQADSGVNSASPDMHSGVETVAPHVDARGHASIDDRPDLLSTLLAANAPVQPAHENREAVAVEASPAESVVVPTEASVEQPDEIAFADAADGAPVEPERTVQDTSILARLPVPILIHSGDVLHYANDEFLFLTGYRTVEMLSQAGGLDALFAETYDDGASDGADRSLRLRAADGAEFPIDALLRAVPWGDGRALMLVVRRTGESDAPLVSPVLEVSERDDLKGRLAEMRTIIDTATDGVVLIDNEGMIRSISRPAEALFGFETDDVQGKPFVSLFAMESQRAARDYLAGLSDNGVASVLNDGRELIGREAEGRFIPLFMSIGRLPNDGGFCAVLRDLTQWKRAEEELTHARSIAERASSQKTDFLARISHEIRTPLNAIIGFSELMMDERFGSIGNERYRDYLRDINRSGNHVLDLVNDLLDISKIEAGEQEMAHDAVSLNETLGQSVAMMQPQANRERVIIRSSLASRLPDVVADLRSVRQIALNLLSNAIRYTQAGGQVIVSTSYEPTGEVVLRIRDTGIGMTQAEIEQALKPFKQINALKRSRGDGTGLGLPLTKAMVEANRARFTINSTPGDGTLVEVTFPATRVLTS